MTSPRPARDEQLEAIIAEQIARMRSRTAGKLPLEEQEVLAALLEDLLRVHPVLSRLTERLVTPPHVVESGDVAVGGEASAPAPQPRPAVSGARPPRKSKKAGGAK